MKQEWGNISVPKFSQCERRFRRCQSARRRWNRSRVEYCIKIGGHNRTRRSVIPVIKKRQKIAGFFPLTSAREGAKAPATPSKGAGRLTTVAWGEPQTRHNRANSKNTREILLFVGEKCICVCCWPRVFGRTAVTVRHVASNRRRRSQYKLQCHQQFPRKLYAETSELSQHRPAYRSLTTCPQPDTKTHRPQNSFLFFFL